MKLRSKALWVLFGDGGAKLFGLLSTLYLARIFGVDAYGQITYALTILGIAGLFTDMGLHTLGTRNRATHFSDGTGSPSDLFWLRIFLAISVIALFSPILWITLRHEPELRTLTILFLFSVLPQSLQTEWHFRGTQRYRWYSLSRWIQSAIYLGGLLLLVQTEQLFTVPIIFSASILFSVAMQWGAYKPLKELFLRPDPIHWKRLLLAGFYLTAGGFLFQTVVLMPPLLMEFRFSLYELGLYGAVFKIILAVMIADRVFTTLLLPSLAILKQSRAADLSRAIRTITLWMLFFGAFGSLGLIAFAPEIIRLLYGEAFMEGTVALRILSLFLPATFVNSVYMFGLLSAGRDKSYLKAGIKGGGVAFGCLAAGAWSGSFTLFLVAVPVAEASIAWFVYRSYRDEHTSVFPGHAWVMCIIFSITAGLMWFFSAAGFFVTIPLLLGFPFCVWFLGGIQNDDISWLKQTLR